LTIVHITTSLEGGGAEQMVFQLAKKSNPNIRTIVLSITNVDTLLHKFESNNIECHFLNVSSFKNSTLANGLKKMHSILKDIPDCVFHCHQYHSNIFAVLYKLRYNRKMRFTFTLHTNAVDSKIRRAFLFLTKPFRKSDIIFSENSNKWYLKNTEVIPNGVDFSNFTANTKRRFDENTVFSFLFLGRLSTVKNPALLITAAQQLLEHKLDNFVVEYVGGGGGSQSMREKLEAKIKKNNLEKHFKFHGFQNNIKDYINNSHCLVLPSFREGMPVVIIEAAASLLPVLSTPVGSIPDFINKSNGYLSSHEDFGKIMIHVMKNYNEAITKAHKLNDDVRSVFDINNVYEQHLTVYKSLQRDTI